MKSSRSNKNTSVERYTTSRNIRSSSSPEARMSKSKDRSKDDRRGEDDYVRQDDRRREDDDYGRKDDRGRGYERGREGDRGRENYHGGEDECYRKEERSRWEDRPTKEREERKHRKQKKHRKRSSSSSSAASSSSSGSGDSVRLMLRLEEERNRLKTLRQEQKDQLKAMETAEEKRIRRLRKKEAKERRRKELMGWDKEYLHYTNADNPFGDGCLLETFVWKKKMEKEGMVGMDKQEVERRAGMKQEESRRELAKVKQRRMEREEERNRREEEMSLLQRQKEAEQFHQWEKQEDQFHLKQATLRSKIRIQDGRAKPIDLLAKYVSAEEDVDAVEMHEPYTYLNGLTISDLEDLIEDIVVYKELEKGRNFDYWSDITVIVQDELHKLRKIERNCQYQAAVDRREGVHSSVADDVAAVFRGKTAPQLEALKSQIEGKIHGKAEGVDIGYWEALLSQLKAHIARARLRDRHQDNLKKKLEMLKAEQGVIVEEGVVKGEDEEIARTGGEGTSRINEDKTSGEGVSGEEISAEGTSRERDEESQETKEEEDNNEEDEEREAKDILSESFEEYKAGSYSPKFMNSSDLEPGTLVVLEEDDAARLRFARQQVIGMGKRVENVLTVEELAMQQEAKKGMTDEERSFAVEASVDSQVYLWSDKYRPRKPRYFNRVHTGFEWNKYNQTHYDMDNPPPKIVQGYKFNIFYPDLIDKGSTPQYHLTPCDDNADFANLRFHAGPPYEDIAFKIVNREWEYSYKRGFRCQFHNNIFQLWFHFKRYRYRR